VSILRCKWLRIFVWYIVCALDVFESGVAFTAAVTHIVTEVKNKTGVTGQAKQVGARVRILFVPLRVN
jgi:hypothetical protein